MIYLLNSESLVQAAHVYYNPSVFKSFWKLLGATHNIKMSSLVYDYITNSKNGFLYKWCKKDFEGKQISPDENIVSEYSILMNWINNVSHRWTSAGQRFWSNPYAPEPWIIATALANNQVIVTLHSNANINTTPSYTKSNLPPNINVVSKYFNVPTISFSELLTKLK